ncbi:hypothetical protein Tco_0693288 [Tanacetum coccineum]
MQTPLQSLPKGSSQPEREHIKKDKGKKAIWKTYLTEEQINQQKNIEEEAKAEAAKQEEGTNKRLKSSVQYEDHLPGIVLNEPVLSMIMFNFYHRQDFETKKELKIEFNKPLKEQDHLNELNDLVNKKRKRTGDSTDHSRSTKKHKSLVQHEEEVH